MPEPRQSIGDTSKDVCQARNPTPPAEVEADESSLAVRLMAGGAPDYRPLLPDSPTRAIHHDRSRHRLRTTLPILVRDRRLRRRAGSRSEEHTSELQSLMRHSYAVFCLKKKNNSTIKTTTGAAYATDSLHIS